MRNNWFGLIFLSLAPFGWWNYTSSENWDEAVVEKRRAEEANINYTRYDIIQATPPFDGVSFSTKALRFQDWQKMRAALRDLDESHEVPMEVIFMTYGKLKTICEGFDTNQLLLDYDTFTISTEINYKDNSLKMYVENRGK